MNKIQKIVVTGDTLRRNQAGAATQTENILWLFNIVRPTLEMLLSLPVSPLLPGTGDHSLDADLFKANRLRPALESWAQIYGRFPSARDLSIIWQYLEGSLVVSFELPEFVRRSLDNLAIPYIDFTVHPARFLDDLAFGVRSNVRGLGRALMAHALHDEEIKIAGGLALATLAKLSPPGECQGHDLAVFAGQTADDKVLIKGNRFLTGTDFLGQFEEMSAKHETILLKPHPYAKDNPINTMLTRLFPNVRLTDTNFYHLVSQPGISHVYSLTSSTSIEAGYLGKTGLHLGSYPYVFSNTCTSPSQYLSIHPDFHLPQFWKAAFTQMDLEVNDVRPLKLVKQRSRMRHTLRSYWGAKILEDAA